MAVKKLLFSFSLLLFTFIACKNDNPVNPLLFGDWVGSEWLREGKPIGQDASQVRFSFTKDGSFTAKFGQQSESGRYDLNGDKLYTTATGQLKKMVKIKTLSQDSLIFQMNRVGTDEVMFLVRDN